MECEKCNGGGCVWLPYEFDPSESAETVAKWVELNGYEYPETCPECHGSGEAAQQSVQPDGANWCPKCGDFLGEGGWCPQHGLPASPRR